jgi:Ca-activated chloride channel family protein
MSYFPLLFIIVIILVVLFYKGEKNYFRWVELHWFFKRTLLSRISSILFITGFVMLLFSMLDLRGPEKYVKGKISDQKTMILIDTSASMLAEDVRPNRFSKALLLARHFVKKAVGHQVSILVFSDSHKQIIPFTKDVDLMDAKLLALEKLNLSRGGTGLTMAVQEAVQYFKVDGGADIAGNILIFTDAEETTEMFDLNIPESVTVGVVGVGTAKGANIPMRNRQGVFRGNKKHDGKAVVTKLNESFLKKLASSIKNYKYWVASSYSLPTEQILQFFNNIYKIKTSEDSFRIRPVMAEYLLIPGVLMLAMSYFLKFFKTYSVGVFLLAIFLSASGVQAQEEEEDKRVKPNHVVDLERLYVQGELDEEGRLLLADELLKNQFPEQADVVYGEAISEKIDETNKSDYFNWAASQLKSKQLERGIRNYMNLAEYLENSNSPDDQEMLNKVKKNLMKALQQHQQQQQNKKDNKKKQQDNKDDQQNDDQQQGDEGNQSQQKDKNKDQEGKDNKDQQNKDQQNKNDQNKDQEKDKNEKSQQSKQNKMPKKKLPALLKQLMSDDNQLQKKLIDAETRKRSRRNRKDW